MARAKGSIEMNRISLALAALLAATSLASAQAHKDKTSTGVDGTVINGVAPIYLYDSAGASQWALAVTTNTTLTVPSGSTLAEICVETAGIRYTDDTTSATTANGIPVVPSSSTSPSCFAYSGPLTALKFTAISGSPTLSVSYYRAH